MTPATRDEWKRPSKRADRTPRAVDFSVEVRGQGLDLCCPVCPARHVLEGMEWWSFGGIWESITEHIHAHDPLPGELR